MNRYIERANDVASTWGPTMWAVVWQSTVLAALVAAICWALRRQSPSVRYILLLILAAKLLVMPFWSVGVAWPWSTAVAVAEPAPAVASAPPVAASSEQSTPNSVSPFPATRAATPQPQTPRTRLAWLSSLMIVWLAVVVGQFVRTAWQFGRLRRLLAESEPVAADINALVAESVALLNLSTAPAARQIAGEGSPFVCGLFRPVLVLPTATLATFETPALRQIVLHELAHIRRKDMWTIWIVHVMRSLFWFHPVAHWIAYRAGLERELACDQLAIARSGATVGDYARTLVRAVSASTQPFALSAAAVAKLDGGHPV